MLRGPRVTLRPWTRDDLPALRRWHNDPEVMQYWGERAALVPEGMFEKDLAPDGRFTTFAESGFFCICDESGRAIGRIEYEDCKLPTRNAELAILIGEKDAWSRGYGSEAISVLLDYLFNEMDAHRVWLEVFAANVRAQRAYEKVGFVREGTWRESWFTEGQWHDAYLYGILRHEFVARRQLGEGNPAP